MHRYNSILVASVCVPSALRGSSGMSWVRTDIDASDRVPLVLRGGSSRASQVQVDIRSECLCFISSGWER